MPPDGSGEMPTRHQTIHLAFKGGFGPTVTALPILRRPAIPALRQGAAYRDRRSWIVASLLGARKSAWTWVTFLTRKPRTPLQLVRTEEMLIASIWYLLAPPVPIASISTREPYRIHYQQARRIPWSRSQRSRTVGQGLSLIHI